MDKLIKTIRDALEQAQERGHQNNSAPLQSLCDINQELMALRSDLNRQQDIIDELQIELDALNVEKGAVAHG